MNKKIIFFPAFCLSVLFLVFSRIFWKCSFSIAKKLKPAPDFRNDIYKKKCEKLHDNRFDYYYTLMFNNPELLANILANTDIARYKRTNQIDNLYSRLKKAQYN